MRFRFLGIGSLFKCPSCINLSELKKQFKLFHYTFFYNELNNSDSITETALFNPLFWFVDNFAYYFGIVFVTLVWSLVANMIIVFYNCIAPEEFTSMSIIAFLINFIIGSWLAVNTVFHYYKGWRTKPGTPPNAKFDNIVSICRKCMTGKPPRTHHCSICKKCVLKMDHHCPWFNNCIGHYNHRYFFLFCTYMTIDCLYLSTIGFHYYQKHVYDMDLRVYDLFFHQIIPSVDTKEISNTWFHKVATVEFFVAFIAGFALFLLTAFNAFLISFGATNIEIRTITFTGFRNLCADHPYHLGIVNNWKMFLGFDDLRYKFKSFCKYTQTLGEHVALVFFCVGIHILRFESFFIKVILPSTHAPIGDGTSWKEYTDLHEKVFKSDKRETFEV